MAADPTGFEIVRVLKLRLRQSVPGPTVRPSHITGVNQVLPLCYNSREIRHSCGFAGQSGEGESESTARNASPYVSSFLGPIPLTASNSVSVVGWAPAIARSVASLKIT